MKIAVNKCFGGFSVTREVVDKLRKKGHKITVIGEMYSDGSGPRKASFYEENYHLSNIDFGIDGDDYNKHRCHTDLIEAIETTKKPSGSMAEIEIVEIPDDVDWELDEYDGIETIREKSRSW